MIAGLILLTVVVGCLLGWVYVLTRRVREQDGWMETPQPDSQSHMRWAPTPEPGKSEAVEIIDAVLNGMARIYNPAPAPTYDIPVGEPPADEPDYDPFKELDEELLRQQLGPSVPETEFP